jgi:lipopolysaccharide/colanic/teichoic acid biosynthesis glycosyltransferase
MDTSTEHNWGRIVSMSSIFSTTPADIYKLSIPNLLYVGENAIHICTKMVQAGYAGLTFEYWMRAVEWLMHRLESGQFLPDAIICDQTMRVDEIKAFQEHLRKAEKLREIPFILLSDKLDNQARQKAITVDADDVYDLNLDPQKLDLRIRFLKKFKSIQAKSDIIEEEPAEENPLLKDRFKYFLKRSFDIVAASMALLLLSPFLAVIAAIIKLQEPGAPVFYVSKRVGTGYKVFDFYKFRTMRVGADQELEKLSTLNQYDTDNSGKKAKFVKIKNDPRVTRFGQWLRNTSLDELPQLWNILKGDMSIVGNRPLPLYEAKTLTQDRWAMRFHAPAGLTGLWQVSKRGKSDMSVEERISLDIRYATDNSFMEDMKLILRTIPALRQKEDV